MQWELLGSTLSLEDASSEFGGADRCSFSTMMVIIAGSQSMSISRRSFGQRPALFLALATIRS